MHRFSISVDDELAEWIEAQAEQRGVSKSKVIRDAIESARVTGFVDSGGVDKVEGEDLLVRIDRIERRLKALEADQGDEAGERTQLNGETERFVAAFQEQFRDSPPTTAHGQEAVTRIFSLLVENGPMKSGELREAVYPEFGERFSSPNSMWQSLNRYLTELDGIKKVGHGKWDADPGSL